MKLQITTKLFLKSWITTEKIATNRTIQESLTSIHLIAKNNTTILEATDLKTSISKIASGVEILEEGEALLPINPLSDLLKKIQTETILFEIMDNNMGILTAGLNCYQIPLYDVNLFPSFPVISDQNKKNIQISAHNLARALEEGGVAADSSNDYPRYINTCYFDIKDNQLALVSTDGKRLALSRNDVQTQDQSYQFLTPIEPMKELIKILPLSSEEHSTTVCIDFDDSLVYFQFADVQYAVRRIDTTFPNYGMLLREDFSTVVTVERNLLIASLERADLIGRRNNHIVVFTFHPQSDLQIEVNDKEMGKIKEVVSSTTEGDPLIIGLFANTLLDGLKVLRQSTVQLKFNGPEGQVYLVAPQDDHFIYMTMPIKIQTQNL